MIGVGILAWDDSNDRPRADSHNLVVDRESVIYVFDV